MTTKYLAKFQSPRAITRPKIIGPERNVNLICNLSLYTHIPSISQSIAKKSGDNCFISELRTWVTLYVPATQYFAFVPFLVFFWNHLCPKISSDFGFLRSFLTQASIIRQSVSYKRRFINTNVVTSGIGDPSRFCLFCIGLLVILLTKPKPNSLGFPIFPFWAYRKKVIPETRRAHYDLISTFLLFGSENIFCDKKNK